MYHTFFACNICCTLRLLIGIFTFSFPTCCTVLWFCTVFGMILCCTVFGMLHSFLVFLFRAQQLWFFTTIFHQSRRIIIQINQSVAQIGPKSVNRYSIHPGFTDQTLNPSRHSIHLLDRQLDILSQDNIRHIQYSTHRKTARLNRTTVLNPLENYRVLSSKERAQW